MSGKTLGRRCGRKNASKNVRKNVRRDARNSVRKYVSRYARKNVRRYAMTCSVKGWYQDRQGRLLLDPNLYVATWPEVPFEEVFKSCSIVQLPTGDKPQMVSPSSPDGRRARRQGASSFVNLCKECRRYSHLNRMVLPLRRVILTKVFFTANMGTVALSMWTWWRYHHHWASTNLTCHQGIPTKRFGGKFKNSVRWNWPARYAKKRTHAPSPRHCCWNNSALCSVTAKCTKW